jgi:thioredoxin 1
MIKVNSESWEKEVVCSEIPVLVNFWANWSPSCKKIDSVLEKFSKEYDGQLKFVKVDYDEERELVIRNQVYVAPTIIIFYRGAPVRGVPGPAPEHIIKAKIERALKVVEAVRKKY